MFFIKDKMQYLNVNWSIYRELREILFIFNRSYLKDYGN